jgi:chemotaxis protein CheD
MADGKRVGMGQAMLGKDEEILAAYGIGSCVVIVCYDAYKKIAVMLHAMLPDKAAKDTVVEKYVDSGVDAVIKKLLENNVSIKDIKAKIFGGAKMIDIEIFGNTIGERNVVKAREVLAAKNIEITGEDTGSNYGRTIEYIVADKKAYVRSFGREEKIV